MWGDTWAGSLPSVTFTLATPLHKHVLCVYITETDLILLLNLLFFLGRRCSKKPKAQSFQTNFGTAAMCVLQVNTQQVTESEFWCDVEKQQERDRTKPGNALQTLESFALPSSPFPSSPAFIQPGAGGAVSSPSGSGPSPATKRIFVHFEVKLKHFRIQVLMSCIVSAASYCTAIHLFYDDTNHTVNYVDDYNALYTWLYVGVIGDPTHWWTSAGHIGGSDPCGVDACTNLLPPLASYCLIIMMNIGCRLTCCVGGR